jgi:hypothetical protein
MTPLSPAAGGDVERVADWRCVCGCRSYARMDEAVGDTFAPGPHVRCVNCKREHYWPADITGAEWVVVPREPTREMWAAMADAIVGKTTVHHDVVTEAVYRAALASAPSPAGEREQENGND